MTQSFLQHLEEQNIAFDKWRNDGEHASLDDVGLYYLDVVMLKDFLRQSNIATLKWVIEMIKGRQANLIPDHECETFRGGHCQYRWCDTFTELQSILSEFNKAINEYSE